MENEILISEENIDKHLNYLNHIRNDFLGLNTEYKIQISIGCNSAH